MSKNYVDKFQDHHHHFYYYDFDYSSVSLIK